MFERFTDRARRSLVLAQEESRQLRHTDIGVDHLLLGLVIEGEGVAAKALAQLGIGVDDLRGRVAVDRPSAPTAPGAMIPFSDPAKATMEGALRESLAMGHNYIGTEHLLLALTRIPSAMAILEALDLTEHAVRSATMATLTGVIANRPTAPQGRTAGTTYGSIHTPGLQWVLERAATVAGDEPVGTQHVLSAIAENPNLVGHAVLAAGGFDLDALDRPPVEWDPAGTLDDTPDRAATRGTHIVVDQEGLVVRFVDPGLRERLRSVLSSPEFIQQLHESIARAIEDAPPTADPDPDSGGDDPQK